VRERERERESLSPPHTHTGTHSSIHFLTDRLAHAHLQTLCESVGDERDEMRPAVYANVKRALPVLSKEPYPCWDMDQNSQKVTIPNTLSS